MGRFEKNSSSYDTAHNARWDVWIPNCYCVDFLSTSVLSSIAVQCRLRDANSLAISILREFGESEIAFFHFSGIGESRTYSSGSSGNIGGDLGERGVLDFIPWEIGE